MASNILRGLIPLLTLTATGCASLGSLEDILAGAGGGLYGDEVRGEIRQVDTRRQTIELESGWGQSDRVRYDNRTEVVYQQRRYDVRDLERGDRVRVRVDDTVSREPYATVVYVEESVRDRDGRDGGYARLQRLDGRVEDVDTREGWFEMRDSGGALVLVTLPYEPGSSVRDRFRRMRRGDWVRVEGELLNRSRLLLHRFL